MKILSIREIRAPWKTPVEPRNRRPVLDGSPDRWIPVEVFVLGQRNWARRRDLIVTW
jgi:hypothetical protein